MKQQATKTKMTAPQLLAAFGTLHLVKAVMMVLHESKKPMNHAEIAEAAGVPSAADDPATTGILEQLWYARAVDTKRDEEGFTLWSPIKSVQEVTKEFSVGIEFGVDDLGLYEIHPDSNHEAPKDPSRWPLHSKRYETKIKERGN